MSRQHRRADRRSAFRRHALTHREYAWQESDKVRPHGSSAPMPYELFFEGEPTAESNALRQLAEVQQEDRDFIAALSR